MLGRPKTRRLAQLIAVSLEDLVPQNHFYRHLETKLDLGFVRGWVEDRYAGRGRPGSRGDRLAAMVRTRALGGDAHA